MSYTFDIAKVTSDCVAWIKGYAERANMRKVVIGISGGKDSYVAAALCCKALGNDKVIGVLMPNNFQNDIDDSYKVCKSLGIKYIEADINGPYREFLKLAQFAKHDKSIKMSLSEQARINIAPRVRMTTLYMIAQSIGARVCGTGNLSEITVGYCTKWGDMASDFNPLANLTSIEVVAIGDYLNLDKSLVHKTPADGLSGMTDEQNLGISYMDIHKYIRGEDIDNTVRVLIESRKNMSRHKNLPVESFKFCN